MVDKFFNDSTRARGWVRPVKTPECGHNAGPSWQGQIVSKESKGQKTFGPARRLRKKQWVNPSDFAWRMSVA